MKFHYSVGPNPRIVRMFMEERGIELPTVEVDIIGNAFGQPLPADAGNLQAWFARVAERPSAEASRHPAERG
jgi:glutathione S-transferase